VYAAAKPTQGVILLGIPSNERSDLPTIVSDFVSEDEEKLATRFVGVQLG